MAIFPLRVATPADAEPLSRLKLATFRQTFLDGFGVPYPPGDLARFEAESYGLARVQAELDDPAHRTWIVEDQDGRFAAYAHVGPCKLPHADASADHGELYQLYALDHVHGRGVGAMLMDAAVGWLDQAMPGPLWLGVWSGNARAQAFYARWGFAKVGDYGFKVGDWTDHEHIYCRAPDRGDSATN